TPQSAFRSVVHSSSSSSAPVARTAPSGSLRSASRNDGSLIHLSVSSMTASRLMAFHPLELADAYGSLRLARPRRELFVAHAPTDVSKRRPLLLLLLERDACRPNSRLAIASQFLAEGFVVHPLIRQLLDRLSASSPPPVSRNVCLYMRLRAPG